MAPGKERHIGTLVGGSRTRIAQFDVDCERIVLALAHYEEALSSTEGAVPDGEGEARS
ncbi:hypothetical protein MIC97_21380 [Aquamicrobium sp. NLF2-7]|uniref:hypothetical protein n=1 Tax=Aquamicrobium sp. NLF2-7 TaxID=2918753 RepID=UPI001EFAADD5|nr:hypothetical protein [Aquamicrobium sp. NLF2-7]MCG8274040.1 hypothetical protein [Aquamicrobium sp. NLF2-7]